MAILAIHLFGRFALRCEELFLESFESRKAQELLCYLLLNRDRPHAREALAGLLWGDHPAPQSKKYLRQALWQLQAILDNAIDTHSSHFLTIEPDWIHVNLEVNLWLDVAVFEQRYGQLIGVPGHVLDAAGVQLLQDTVQLYQGDLLEGWYQDWCLYERERLQNMYLSLLDKLIDCYEAKLEYETGLAYAQRLLQYDGARERTHRRLIRLYYLNGDRTAALRQYERCVAALDKELGVKPSARTLDLYEQIRADRLKSPAHAESASETGSPLPEVLLRLKELQMALTDIQHKVQQDVRSLEQLLSGCRSSLSSVDEFSPRLDPSSRPQDALTDR